MTRLDMVREFVENRCRESGTLTEFRGVEAAEVAKALSIWRNDASADLNKLCVMGILKKDGKKPVFYSPVKLQMRTHVQDDPVEILPISQVREIKGYGKIDPKGAKYKSAAFKGIVGCNGSLKTQIQMAKAAVLYPPNGLHTLIIGETGVGKSLFAEEMWRFAEESHCQSESKSKPFIVFNCAEYADNPQLLLSQLFGHTRGAFTGANESKVGLVEKADGGILFLDEIHRLPPIGQEIFFMLIDKGLYRRLGDTQDRSANMMIIGATTEEPSSILLQTFKRRIPVVIQLPTLMERPMNEKISLIGLFLSQEANRLNASIWISGHAFQTIVTQICKTNIGDLKNVIQLCCAKSYLSYLSSADSENRILSADNAQQPFLSIDVNDLPQGEYTDIEEMSISKDSVTKHVFSEGMTAFPGMSAPFESFTNDYELAMDLYGFVEKQLKTYQLSNLMQSEIERLVTMDLEKYYGNTIKAMHNHAGGDDVILNSIITQKMWSVASHLLSLASRQLDRKYSKSIQAALALHLQQLKERENGHPILINSDLRYMKSKYEIEVSFLRSILPQLSGMLDMTIPEEEIGFLSMFLGQAVDEQPVARVGLIVVAHGHSTATSMADFANQILSTDHIVGINAPVNKSLLNVYNDLGKAVEECDQGKGVLLLVDMGSFANIQKDICSKTKVACRVIPNVSSALVLEAGKVVISSSESLDEIADKVTERYREYINTILPAKENRQFTEAQKNIPADTSTKKRDVIITVCSTGIGSAKKLGELITEKVPAAKDMEIVPLSILDDVKGRAEAFDQRLKLIVGNFNPGIDKVPFFSIEAFLMGDGIHRIERLLRIANPIPPPGEKKYSREYMIRFLEKQIGRFAPSFDKDMVMAHTVRILDRIETEMLQAPLPMDISARVILHVASMLERLKIGDIVPMPSWGKEQIKRNRATFDKLKAIVNGEVFPFGFTVSDSELAYMMTNLINDPAYLDRIRSQKNHAESRSFG